MYELTDKHAEERDKKINRYKRMVMTSRPNPPHEKTWPTKKKKKTSK